MSTENNKQPAPKSDAWNTYWTGDKDGPAFSNHGDSQPALLEFWRSNLNEFLQERKDQQIKSLDLACGNGAVTQLIHQSKGEAVVELHCLDASSSALNNVQALLPEVKTVLSSMQPIELADGKFDLVVSQYGVEYAGLNAFDEAARMVAPNGAIFMVVHMVGSLIEAESKANFSAISELIDSNFVDQTIEVLNSVRARIKVDNAETQNNYNQAFKNLNEGIQSVEGILTQYGLHIASGTVQRLYNDVANIIENIQKYDLDEVQAWLVNMRSELHAFKTRMQTMVDAALSQDEFNDLSKRYASYGFTVTKEGTLIDTASDTPLAWALCAKRS